jgi:hypothetical protein
LNELKLQVADGKCKEIGKVCLRDVKMDFCRLAANWLHSALFFVGLMAAASSRCSLGVVCDILCLPERRTGPLGENSGP